MLTDEQIKDLYGDDNNFELTGPYVISFARAIEDEATAPLIARIAELEADAKRYLTIRNADMDLRNRIEHYSGSALDVFIDAAMKEQP
jgi:hypothetical protein